MIWSEWKKFPNPQKMEYLVAPFGMGVYQLRNMKTMEFVLFGSGKNLAYRMSSLLPFALGQGTRINTEKQLYVYNFLTEIEYRTMPFVDAYEMKRFEKNLKAQTVHLFNE